MYLYILNMRYVPTKQHTTPIHIHTYKYKYTYTPASNKAGVPSNNGWCTGPFGPFKVISGLHLCYRYPLPIVGRHKLARRQPTEYRTEADAVKSLKLNAVAAALSSSCTTINVLYCIVFDYFTRVLHMYICTYVYTCTTDHGKWRVELSCGPAAATRSHSRPSPIRQFASC
ncbi:unnamed protein product [Ceratitis capitata]|uniref:(Mediterranean fruit fly) hypothetical protein n=1 Tax=Ceratitis capitata TaxID=7213 RepID=A0A811V009_CERCA|nr:unnamed protein product [Ceratitis capitata]